MTSKEITFKIQKNINWDNWLKADGKPMHTNDVLNCKITHIEEHFNYEDEHSEHLDTLEIMKKVLKLVNIDDIVLNSK